ncbi:putative periplasmic serine endoprotease DegP-like precursor [compost metagenome]
MITNLVPKGPAANSGLKVYDIVTEFNGRKIKNSLELMDAVSDATIGKPVKATAIRNRKTVAINLTVAERPDDKKPVTVKPTKYSGQKAPFDLGFTLMDPTADLRKEWGLPDDMKQPVVIETVRSSNASRAGLRVGDVILDVNKQSVEGSKDVLKLLKKGNNTLRIARNTRIQIINIEAN